MRQMNILRKMDIYKDVLLHRNQDWLKSLFPHKEAK